MANNKTDRLDVQMKGFSEITAMSQRAINTALGKLAEEYPELVKVDAESKKTGHKLKATLNQPEVSLYVRGTDFSSLKYQLHFASGTLHFNFEEPEDFDVTGWKIAFDVSLDLSKLKPGSDAEKRAKDAINQAGDYSIFSLFLVFNEGDIIKLDPDNCDFQKSELDVDDRSALGGLLANWTIEKGPLIDQEKRTIGYAMHTESPQSVNEEAPSFPPTSLKFQTYPYIAAGETEPKEGIPDGDNNMLLYLQMTDKQDFPKDNLLQNAGNFIAAGMDGTMCIEREIFWDRYLLRETPSPILHLFNSATYVWVQEADLNAIFHPHYQLGVGASSHKGDSKFFNWNFSEGNSFPLTWGPKLAEQHYEQKKNPHYGPETGWLNIDCSTSNNLTAKAGSNVIEISGKTDIKIFAKGERASAWLAEQYDYTLHVWLDWKTTITINVVEEGGLDISVALDDSTFTVHHDKPITHFNGMSEINNSDIAKSQQKVLDDLEEHLANLPLKDTMDKMQTALHNTARFVVPGVGSLRYKNPVFNKNGDLMIQVDYK